MFANPMQTLGAIVINESVNLALLPGMCCPHRLLFVISVSGRLAWMAWAVVHRQLYSAILATTERLPGRAIRKSNGRSGKIHCRHGIKVFGVRGARTFLGEYVCGHLPAPMRATAGSYLS